MCGQGWAMASCLPISWSRGWRSLEMLNLRPQQLRVMMLTSGGSEASTSILSDASDKSDGTVVMVVCGYFELRGCTSIIDGASYPHHLPYKERSKCCSVWLWHQDD